MKLTIYSHFRKESWTGEAPFPDAEPAVLLEAVFRAFNRVDQADVERLDAWGYKLPSLSVDDLVTIPGGTYRVGGVGFELVEERPS